MQESPHRGRFYAGGHGETHVKLCRASMLLEALRRQRSLDMRQIYGHLALLCTLLCLRRKRALQQTGRGRGAGVCAQSAERVAGVVLLGSTDTWTHVAGKEGRSVVYPGFFQEVRQVLREKGVAHVQYDGATIRDSTLYRDTAGHPLKARRWEIAEQLLRLRYWRCARPIRVSLTLEPLGNLEPWNLGGAERGLLCRVHSPQRVPILGPRDFPTTP